MSFDLRIVNGDFSFGPDGNPVLVTGTDKLQQDIEKIILTRIGQDPGYDQFGSDLIDRLGDRYDFGVLQGMVAKSINDSLNVLQSLQFLQSTKQALDFAEVIGNVGPIAVSQGGHGAINVQVAVTTVAGLRITYATTLGG